MSFYGYLWYVYDVFMICLWCVYGKNYDIETSEMDVKKFLDGCKKISIRNFQNPVLMEHILDWGASCDPYKGLGLVR